MCDLEIHLTTIYVKEKWTLLNNLNFHYPAEPSFIQPLTSYHPFLKNSITFYTSGPCCDKALLISCGMEQEPSPTITSPEMNHCAILQVSKDG